MSQSAFATTTALPSSGARLGSVARWACAVMAVVALGLRLARPLLALYPAPGEAWVFVPLFPRAALLGGAFLLLLISLCALCGDPARPAWRVRLLFAGAPWVAWLLWVAPVLPPTYRAPATFYLPLFWLVTLAYHARQACPERPFHAPPRHRRLLTVFLIGATLFYTVTGVYYTTCCGPRAGDEGYYLIQVDSLHNDGDTDIRNDLGKKISHHISPFTRLPHFYSFHPPGLPFLLTPLYDFGVWGRHLVLGLISALGLFAVLALCRRLDVPRSSALLIVLLHGLSIYWIVYSSRCLPEVMGASLVALVFWASARQRDYPWSSGVIAAACTSYLPLASIRFLPVVAGCGLFYLVAALLDDRPARAKVRPLVGWALLLLAGVTVVQLYQNARFVGGFSHPVGHMLFSKPLGGWLALAHYKGITNIYPAYLWLLAANVVWLLRVPKTRWYALGALGLFTGVWITSCMVSDWGGGSTMGGRFLVVTMAVLLPGAAWWWSTCSPAARWALLMLAGLSIYLAAWQLCLLPGLGGNFARPWGELMEVTPSLVGIRYFLAQPAMLIWLAAGVFLLVVLPADRVRTGWGIVLMMLALGVVTHLRAEPMKFIPPYYHDYATSPSWMAEHLRPVRLDRFAWSTRTGAKPAPLFSLTDRFYTSAGGTNAPSVHTQPHEGDPLWCINQSALEPNDWQQRPLRWATLKTPFDAGPGARVFRLQGWMRGAARPILAIVEGQRTLVEKELPVGPEGWVDQTEVVTCRGRGHTYLLLRLDGGDGSFIGHRIAWSPYAADLFGSVGVTLGDLK